MQHQGHGLHSFPAMTSTMYGPWMTRQPQATGYNWSCAGAFPICGLLPRPCARRWPHTSGKTACAGADTWVGLTPRGHAPGPGRRTTPPASRPSCGKQQQPKTWGDMPRRRHQTAARSTAHGQRSWDQAPKSTGRSPLRFASSFRMPPSCSSGGTAALKSLYLSAPPNPQMPLSFSPA